jgi:Holliday junction resolvasome RuvABC endonuclease subunit
MRTLSIDPGRHTGWALWHGDSLRDLGTVDMGSPPDLARLWYLLHYHNPQRLTWEEPQGMRGMGLVRIQRYLGVLELYAQLYGIPYASVSQRELKAHATGSGSATKEEVTAAMSERYGLDGITHDEADAIAVGHYASERLNWTGQENDNG